MKIKYGFNIFVKLLTHFKREIQTSQRTQNKVSNAVLRKKNFEKVKFKTCHIF